MTSPFFRTWHAVTSCLFTTALLAIGSTMPLTAVAQNPSTAESDAATVEPFVGETTFLIAKVDLAQIEFPDSIAALNSLSPVADVVYRQLTQRAGDEIGQLRGLVDDQPVFAVLGVPISSTRNPSYVFVKRASEATIEPLRKYFGGEPKRAFCIHGDYVVTTPVHNLDVAKSLDGCPASPRESVADAFQAVDGYPVQILLLPPPHIWRTVRELAPELPPHLGGGPSSVLTDGIQWAALGIDPAHMQAELVIQSATDSAARDLAAHLPKMLQSVYNATPQIHNQFSGELAETLIGWLAPEVEGSRTTIRLEGLDQTSANVRVLVAVALTIEERTRLRRNQDCFRSILLAGQNHHDTYGTFPPIDKFRDDEGKPHLSWRVHLLPYLDQRKLYEQFHLDEPWDSPHNKTLITRMPDVYRSDPFEFPQDTIKPGTTTFLAPIGENTVFGGTKATAMGQIADGTSRTAMLVDVKPSLAVPWTAPEDYRFDPQDPASGLRIGSEGRWQCGFAEGSVRQLRSDIPVEMFLRLFQMSDRQIVDFNELE